MPDATVEKWWKPAILGALGLGLILVGPFTATGGCGGNVIVIENIASSDELPKNATITQYQALEPDFQTEFGKAVEDLNTSRTDVPKTFQYPSSPVGSGEYVQYEDRYYEVFVMHGDCGTPSGVVLTVFPGLGLVAVAFIWVIAQVV